MARSDHVEKPEETFTPLEDKVIYGLGALTLQRVLEKSLMRRPCRIRSGKAKVVSDLHHYLFCVDIIL